MTTMKIFDLHKSFRGREVLCGIDLCLEDGVYGLLGPNGAGKTTLIRCITGLYDFQKGKIDALPRNVGYLPQHFGAYKELSVLEAMEFFSVLKELSREKAAGEIESALEKVNLLSAKNEKVRALSGGMLRRLGIAQTLLGDPKVLIYDEPTTGLDPEERLRFKRLIAEIAEDRAVIISTHIVEDVEAVCDKIIVMNEGKVLCTGTGEEIAAAAEGKVFQCGAEQLTEEIDGFIEKEFEENGVKQYRILGKGGESFRPLSPHIEDGYLCLLKNI